MNPVRGVMRGLIVHLLPCIRILETGQFIKEKVHSSGGWKIQDLVAASGTVFTLWHKVEKPVEACGRDKSAANS